MNVRYLIDLKIHSDPDSTSLTVFGLARRCLPLVLVIALCLPACHNVLLTSPLGTDATLVNAPFENPDRSVNILMYVDGPPRVLQTREEGPYDVYTFYNLIYNAFAIHGEDIYLVTGSYAAKRAGELGMDTSAIEFGKTFLADSESHITHLNFKDRDFSRLLMMAGELGVTHIIKARLDDISTQKTPSKTYFRFWSKNAHSSVTGEMVSTNMRITVDVYDVTLRKRLYAKSYDFYDEKSGLFLYSGSVKKAVVDSILGDIDQRTRQVFRTEKKDSKFSVDYPVAYKLAGDNESASKIVFDLKPRIESIERKDDFLIFSLSLENISNSKVIIDAKQRDKRVSTFIIDRNREVFWSSSNTLGNKFELPPGKKGRFQFVFPHKGGNLGNVNLLTSWGLRVGYRRSVVALTFTELNTPDNFGRINY